MLEGLAVALGVVFVAELGDRSQLLTLTFAARYGWRPVLAGVVAGTAVLMGLSVAVGTALGDALPRRPIEVVAGLLFLAFAVWTLRGDDEDDEPDGDVVADGTQERPVATALRVGGAFALAELGDKTMLTTITLASTNGWLGTWLGATAGMVAANVLALLVGAHVATRVPPRVVRGAAATVFAVFGVLLLVGVG